MNSRLETLIKGAIEQALLLRDRETAAELSALLYYLCGQDVETSRRAAA